MAGAPGSVIGRDKDVLQYGEGLIINIPYTVDEVSQAVQDVAGSGIIRGTKEYQEDEYVTGAEPAATAPEFAKWTEPGKVFYKVRKGALNPWNFKDSADIGTIAVRYVVQPQGDKNTILRIDAVFVEDNRHAVHPSNGSVESNEYKDIQDHIAATELLKKETAEALQVKQQATAKKDFGLANSTELLSTPAADQAGESTSRPDLAFRPVPVDDGIDPNETPEQRLVDLRHKVERLVKKPGAPLKSAPFHSASTLVSLPPGTEVLIVILTPYWLGVETRDGQHGWMLRDELETLP
jgi:hypothetical protein